LGLRVAALVGSSVERHREVRMGSFNFEIADDILDEARIPPDERESVLKRELAVQLYARELLPKAAARRLSGMDRVSFDLLLGQRGIASRLTLQDFDDDLAALAALGRAADEHGSA
jgi:predicted HTH domain antitoxin